MNMKRKYAPIFAAAAFVLVLGLILAGRYLIKKYTPSEEMADIYEYFNLTEDDDMAIVFEGALLSGQARYINGHVYLPYTFVHDYINERFFWDGNENLLLYTTATDVIRTEPSTADYYVSNKKTTGDFGEIVKLDGEKVFVNIEYVDMFSDFIYEIFTEPNRIIIEGETRTTKEVTVKKDTEIRVLAGIKSPILKTSLKGEVLEIVEEYGKWVKVRTADGIIGCVKEKFLGKVTTGKIEVEVTEENFTHQFADGAVCMGWHQIDVRGDNNEIGEILSTAKGITVISPTWFYLNDSYGGIGSMASLDYVNYCHSQGVEVWALVSNFVDKSIDTTKVLTHTTYRENLVNRLVAKAIEYKLDGINLDFESLDREVGDAYVQLIRELALKCHANGLTLSVDNYVPTNYTAFYNRSQQALFADYIVVMAYDEHYVGSDAGSVSSIGFVEQGIKGTLQEVPAEQIILGLPFYCRLWEETPVYNEEGDLVSTSTSSTAYGINGAERVVNNSGAEAVWDESVGQYFARYEKDGKVYRIWIEEERSIELKLQLMKEYNLAGVSFWKLGLDREQTWNMIVKYLN